jgi:hypothetical protein
MSAHVVARRGGLTSGASIPVAIPATTTTTGPQTRTVAAGSGNWDGTPLLSRTGSPSRGGQP